MSIILLVTSGTWYNMVSLLFSFLFKLNLVLLLRLIQSLGDRYTRFKSRCVDDIIYSLYVYVCLIWPVRHPAICSKIVPLFYINKLRHAPSVDQVGYIHKHNVK